MKQRLVDTLTLAMYSGMRMRYCNDVVRSATHQGSSVPTFLLRLCSFNSVAVIPDPQDHCWPISTTSDNLKRLNAFSESKDVNDTAATRSEAKATEKRVLDG